MIDKTSLKILNELRQDGRASNAQIARKTGVSMVTVARKINAMIEEGVIEIKAMVNPGFMGYHHQAVVGLSIDMTKVKSICRRLTKNIHVNMLTSTFGRYDIMLIVFYQELETLHAYIKGELPQIKGINKIETYFILRDQSLGQGLFPDVAEQNKQSLVDDLDRRIIAELIRDGRPNYGELAEKLGVSKPTIFRRISILLKGNVIRILAIPDPSKLGYMANALVLIKAEYNEINRICDHLFNYPEINLVMKLVNEFDILFGIYTADLDKLYTFLENKVGKIKGILQTETFMRGNLFYFSADGVFTPHVG